MPRRQEAEGMRTKDGRPALLAQEELEAKLPGGQEGLTHRFSVMALSHSWESREIPDVARFQQGAPAQWLRFAICNCKLCAVAIPLSDFEETSSSSVVTFRCSEAASACRSTGHLREDPAEDRPRPEPRQGLGGATGHCSEHIFFKVGKVISHVRVEP